MPRQAAQDLAVYNDDTDSAMYAAYRQRAANPDSQQTQDELGPLSHEQFTREVTGRNPIAGAAVMLGSSAYSGAKMLAEGGSAAARDLVNSVGTGPEEGKVSKASMAEIGGSMTGFGKGLKDYFKKIGKSMDFNMWDSMHPQGTGTTKRGFNDIYPTPGK